MANKKVQAVFEDPRGKRVILYEQTWEMHITERHPEMLNRFFDLKATVENPNHIRQGRVPATEELYVKYCETDYVFVSTRFTEEGFTIVTI